MPVEFATNPFGEAKNATSLPKYGTPVTAISSVLFNNVDSIFAYKSFSQPDLLHQDLKNGLKSVVTNHVGSHFSKSWISDLALVWLL